MHLIIIISVVEWEVGGSQHVKIIASRAGVDGGIPPTHSFNYGLCYRFVCIRYDACYSFINYTVAFMFTFYK
jgi:hypothetical protein